MDLSQAIKFAQLVNAAYAIDPTNMANSGPIDQRRRDGVHGCHDDLCE